MKTIPKKVFRFREKDKSARSTYKDIKKVAQIANSLYDENVNLYNRCESLLRESEDYGPQLEVNLIHELLGVSSLAYTNMVCLADLNKKIAKSLK